MSNFQIFGASFKKRAPKAIKEIKAFAHKAMVRSPPTSKFAKSRVSSLDEHLFDKKKQGTKDVRVDPQLNKEVWKQGIKGVPYRLRVRICRRRNDEEGAKDRLYSYVQAVNVKNPKGLQTSVVCFTSQMCWKALLLAILSDH